MSTTASSPLRMLTSTSRLLDSLSRVPCSCLSRGFGRLSQTNEYGFTVLESMGRKLAAHIFMSICSECQGFRSFSVARGYERSTKSAKDSGHPDLFT